jgi:NADP-dependent 3-hydroxy acid dehydrogenase YdfG
MNTIRSSPLSHFDIHGRVALVTGASSGIGRHLAMALGDAGASVNVLARREQPISDLARDIKGHAMVVDLGAAEDFDALAAEASAMFGPPTILINAAGVNLRQPP